MFSSRSRMDRSTHNRHQHREEHSRSSRKSTDRIQSKRFNYLSNLKTLEKQFSVTTRHPQPSMQLQSHHSSDLLEQGKRHYKQNNPRKAVECFTLALAKDDSNLQLNYMLGMCFLSLEKFERAANCFRAVLKDAPTSKRNLFLLLAICYKKLEQLDRALECITEAFLHYPEYLDAYIYRAKLNMKLKKYEAALQDFDVALKLEGGDTFLTKVSRSDCLKFLNRLREATEGYSECLRLQPKNYAVLLKRAICSYELEAYQLAKKDLEVLVEKKQGGSDTYYFRAMIELKQGNAIDASLYFSEAITENTSAKAVARSIEELAIIKIEARDFYEATEVLKRSQFLDSSQSACINRLRAFVEAVIFLMKRKFEQAEEQFQSFEADWFAHPRKVLKSLTKSSEFLLPYYHLYRAYGLFCMGQHQEALSRYNQLEWPLDEGCEYNRAVCQGLVANNRHDRAKAFNIFERLVSAPKLPRMQPYFYLAVMHLQDSIQNESSDNILKAVQLLTDGLQISELSNLYYYRALVYLFLSMNAQALEDIDKAIEKSEDNIPKYFYIRGLIFAMEGNFKQAINDLSTCISLDENFYEAYVERAKCYMLENELMLAYSDLEQVPNNQQWIAVFFIHNNQFEEAYHLIDPKETELLEMVALRLGKWDEAGVSGKLCATVLDSNDEIDKLLESAISSGIPIGYFQLADLQMLRGCISLAKDPDRAIDYFREGLLTLEANTFDESSVVEEQYNEIKITQAKLNIVFALLEKQCLEGAAELLATIKEDTTYIELKYKMEELSGALRGQIQLSRANFFNQGEMLSKYFPERSLALNGSAYSYRPYVSFPLLPLPPIASSFDPNILRGFLLDNIENKPEAPWIRRLPQGIVFTDQVQIFEHLKLETSQGDANENKEEDEQDASDADRESKLERLKQNLRLDSHIEEKLNRLSGKAGEK